MWPEIQRGVGAAADVASHVARGHWSRYSVFAGTNVAGDLVPIVEALLGRLPLTDGPAIAEYERRFAEKVGTQWAISFAAGRMGFYALLRALGIGPGDEVLLPAFTCVVVANAILYCGARPVYVDIDSDTFNMDVRQLAERITTKSRAVVAQHTFGRVCDIDAINDIATRHGLAVIEDCAHALGASNAGRPAGSLGTAAYFSTDHTKIISTGAGGMVTTDDADLAARVSAIQRASPFLPSWRIRRLLAALASEIVLLSPELCLAGRYLQALFARMGLREGFFADELLTTLPATPAYPARLSNAQAVIGLRQLDTLDSNLAWRRHVVALFDDALETVGRGGSRQALLRYTFLVENREAWIRHLEQAVDPNVWFTSVVHGRDLNLNEVAYEWGSCPTAEQSALHCVNLPTHRRIRRPERLVDLVRSALHSADPAFRLMRT